MSSKLKPSTVPKKYHPKGFEILHEDLDVIVGNKAAGFLTVGAKWNPDNTIHGFVNHYVRKGSFNSKKCVYIVHRLDQGTSGVLIFAKNEKALEFLKEDWPDTVKTYYAIVHGILKKKSGLIESYLQQDEDYVVHSSPEAGEGRKASTEYEVVKEANDMSLLRINLLTGRKNQIRVHLAEEGHPVVGDGKYGRREAKQKNLALHAYQIEFTHPFNHQRMTVTAKVPPHFRKLIDFKYD